MKAFTANLSRAKRAKDAKMNLKAAAAPFALTAIAAALLFATPSRAQVDADCTGSNPGTVSCTATTYADGVTHTATGDLTVNVTGAVTSFGTGGFNTTATGNANVTMTKGDGPNMNNAAATGTTAGTLIGATTENGNISISTGTGGIIRGVNTTAQYGIRALSTGAGDISIATSSGGGIVVSNDAGPGVAGVSAQSQGGNIDITTAGLISGRQYGIQASTTGAGTINLTTGGGSTTGSGNVTASTTSGIGIAAVHAVAELGNITFTGTGGIQGLVHLETQGTITANVANGGRLSAFGGYGSSSLRLISSSRAAVNFISTPPDPRAGTRGLRMVQPFDLSGLSSGVDMRIEATRWVLDGSYLFSPGDDVVHVAAGALISSYDVTQSGGVLQATGADFGGGVDTLRNAAVMLLGPTYGTWVVTQQVKDYGSTTRFENLERFENAGTIFLGAKVGFSTGPNVDLNAFPRFEVPHLSGTDGWADDILSMPGTHWVGMPGSVVVLDARLGSTAADGQNACTAAVRTTGGQSGQHPGWLPSADCIDLRGGGASGETLVEIMQTAEPGRRGAYNPEGYVIVDLAGGDPADIEATAFRIAPASFQYSGQAGGIIDKGLLAYSLGYDADDQQFKLYGVLAPGGYQLPLIGTAASELWREGADAWFSRQVDQRDVKRDDGRGGGFWARASNRSADRDVNNTFMVGSGQRSYDNGYTQDSRTMTLGLDAISRRDGNRAWVLGGMIGYAQADVAFDDHAAAADLEGMQVGLYGSVTAGNWYLDAVLNTQWLDLHADIQTLALRPAGTLASTNVESLGIQVETGMRLPLGVVTVEPLLGLSQVKADFGDLSIPADDSSVFGASVQYKGARSLRGSLGARLRSMDLFANTAPTAFLLEARAINEFEGESNVTIVNQGPDAVASDTFDGTFTKLTGSVNVSNPRKNATGFLNIDTATGSDYSSLGFSAGFRYQW